MQDFEKENIINKLKELRRELYYSIEFESDSSEEIEIKEQAIDLSFDLEEIIKKIK